MFAPLRQPDFSEISGFSPTSSWEVLHARTSAVPTPKAKASMANGRASTSKPSASSESADLVGSLLRTALISELGALTGSRPHWKHSATPAGSLWLVLTMPARTTNASGLGSSDATLTKLPTPMASDGMKDGAGGGAGSTYLFRAIISTPRASDMKAGGHGDTGRMGTVRHMLATPRKTDADRGFRGDVRAQLDGQNSRHAGMLPTPVTQSQQGGMRWEGGAGGRKVLQESGLLDVMAGRTPMAAGAQSASTASDGLGNAMNVAKLPTPRASDMAHGPEMTKARGEKLTGMGLRTFLHPSAQAETLPTPTKRDKRMDAWSPTYDKRKSPTMDAVMDGALTDRASGKWVYARQIAAVLTNAGLSGASMTLLAVYGWMMGYPPGWLERALLSAVQKEQLPLASSSKRTATPSSRKSRKRSAAPSGE